MSFLPGAHLVSFLRGLKVEESGAAVPLHEHFQPSLSKHVPAGGAAIGQWDSSPDQSDAKGQSSSVPRQPIICEAKGQNPVQSGLVHSANQIRSEGAVESSQPVDGKGGSLCNSSQIRGELLQNGRIMLANQTQRSSPVQPVNRAPVVGNNPDCLQNCY